MRRRVDDPRHARDRSARLGYRPLLRPPQDLAAHQRPDDRGLQQDLRHRPSDGAMGEQPAHPALARRGPPCGARRRRLRGRRLGAAVLVRIERAAPRRVRGAGHAAGRGMGFALVEPAHQRRAPRDAGPGRSGGPVRVRDLRHHGTRRPRRARATVCQQGGRTPGQDRLHAAPQRGRRHPRRPHDHAARPRPLPGRDRRRHGHARQEDLHRWPAGRWNRPARRPDERDDDVRAMGSPGTGHPRVGHRCRCQPRRFPVPDLEVGGHRWRPDAGIEDQLCRRARLGDLRPDGAGPPGLGRAVGRREAPRHGPGRDRHVRGHVPAREGLPSPRRGTGARFQPGRGGHGPALAQGRGLRRPRGLRGAASRRPGHDPVHADG